MNFKHLKDEILELLENKKYSEIIEKINLLNKEYFIEVTEYDYYRITPYDRSVSTKFKINYVNASFVRNVIACQEPKPKFYDDFIDLINKSGVELIISLKSEVSYLKDPIESKDVYLNDKLFLVDEIFYLENKVRRITCKIWEDFGVIKPEQLLFLHDYIGGIENKKCIVHCKAGLGRTGTFLMYEFLIEKESVSPELFVDTFLELRSQRPYLVETSEQFKLLVDIFIKQF